jgi:hypothetical protein
MKWWRPLPLEPETLLTREARARLPLPQLLLIYFDPFALFKDASRGPLGVRERAAAFNCAMRWMLLAYLRRWVFISGTLFLAIAPAEALAAQSWVFRIPTAALAVGCCIAVTVSACTVVAYLLLGKSIQR